MKSGKLFSKVATMGLRGLSLASKLILTLYMGRYLGLADLGVYGLVFGAVMIACVVLGGRLDFVVTRDLVGQSDLGALTRMRDQAVYYGFNYLLFLCLIALLAALRIAPPFILFSVAALSILESLSNMTSVNLIALERPTLSTFLFFVRAGLWCLVVAAIGIFFPATRNVETVLVGWMIGSGASFLLTLYVWRSLPWAEALRTPVDWPRLKRGIKKSFPIWLGTLGGVAALHVDRFIVSYYLDLEKVGVITFFASFSMALLSLVQSGFFAFAIPRLIRHHKSGETEAFWRETRATLWQTGWFVGAAALVVGFAVPVLGGLLGKPLIALESPTLWLLLAAVWIRGQADALYYVLYARHQDWVNWTGDLLFLVPSLGGNLLLIPLCGLEGVGYSSILAACFLLAWHAFFVKYPNTKIFL